MPNHPQTGHPARPRRWLVRAATTLAAWVVAFGVVTALLALFGAELGSPQPVSEWLRRIGRREGHLGEGRHAMTLQRLAVAVKLTTMHPAA